MSGFEIKMPKLGESITEGTIVSWSVQVGDVIREDDVLFEVNTAKVSAEIPSPVAGRIVEILFKEGDTVAVGTVVAVVDMGGDDEPSEPSAGTKESVKAPVADNTGAGTSPVPVQELPKAQAAGSENERWYSPVVLQLAREARILQEELDRIPGTGYQGRLSKKDIKQYIIQKQNGAAGVAAAKPTVAAVPQSSPVTATSVAEGIEVKEMDRVRRMIADHMVMSKHTSPHVTTLVEVDMTKLVKWREKNKEAFFKREGVKLTYMPAITEATAKALVAYPQVNVSVEGYNILFKKHINVGIAVSQNDGNLIVPVVHDADRLNLSGLAIAIDGLAAKARINKLMPDDIAGGTFTITNFGTFKSLFGTPIINQPQVAILGVGVIEKKPAVMETPEGDVIAIRHKMYLSLSYDHRVVDGALGGNFLYFIKNYLENWNE
ncbi:2-oxo acid dehydrogenase subunit E2 [Bacteroides eggerthii]|uniref:Dihydrolipoamide acetyltransferase component of pyruvate dehydrogenase complex n=1 Tax=Bacteroides eggerthii TaxID=28111 RepID=A0A414MCM3_9BACE|nr:dihydrolipoamide acetyltransferase family protein [Bacteroides eggerthii]MBT9881818.1 2-oxo acid dehydrogenase subunit E2 [Bacteroides eggerthii]RGU00235.1 2-oxo acid dehydrogenase subunit E2 [Bacteroides eggerthii]RHF08815.1 2-oxo acid dehydrogenase subunit E2 [Bacteroides eggerthii]RHH21693.1 2-oxo acid dehydrogenase subunit E2 [Bacteroides eggerthii]